MSHANFLEKLLDGAGVEWKPLGEFIHSLKTGLNPRQNFQLNTEDATGYYVTVREIQNGKIVFLDKTDRVNAKALELINGRSNLEAGDILFSGTGTVGRTAVIEEVPMDWNIKEGVYVIKPNQKRIMPRYLSHLLNSSEIVKEYSKKIVGSPVISLPMSDLKRLQIPIPCPENPKKSLEIQAEIVRILDAFTAYTTELTAEQNTRNKQYAHYRDKLLNFEEGEVAWKTLLEACDYVDYRGKTPKKSSNGIFLVTAKNIRMGYIDYQVSQEFIPRDDYALVMKRGYPKLGDVLITTEAPCGFVAQVDRENIALAQRVIKYSSKDNSLSNSFLKHYLLSGHFQNELNKTATGSTVKGIKGSKLHQLKIPIPPLAEQARIIAILDKFEALTNSISEGLPREIELRQKQYEYYRDMLFNFPKPQGVA